MYFDMQSVNVADASCQTPKTKLSLCRKPTKVRLWSIWYSLLCGAAEIYLLWKGVQRFQTYSQLDYPGASKPTTELHLQLTSLVLSVLLFPFIVYLSLWPTGNVAGDSKQLPHVILVTPLAGWAGRLHKLWQISWPPAAVIHLTSAWLLWLPSVFLPSTAFRRGVINDVTGSVWWTDVGFIIGDGVKNDIEVKVLEDAVNQSAPANSSSYSALQFSSMSFNTDPGGPSGEFAYFFFAFVLFQIVYPAIVWKGQKTLCLLFSLHLFASAVHHVFSICGLQLLFKCQSLKNVDFGFILSPVVTVTLGSLSSLVLFVSEVAVMWYALHHFNAFIKVKAMTKFNAKKSKGFFLKQSLLKEYAPHLSASLSILIAYVIRAPVIRDQFRLYTKSDHKLSLFCTILDGLYFIWWAVFWLGLTMKQTWKFNFKEDIFCQANNVISDTRGTERKVESHSDGTDTDHNLSSTISDKPSEIDVDMLRNNSVDSILEDMVASGDNVTYAIICKPKNSAMRDSTRSNKQEQHVTFNDKVLSKPITHESFGDSEIESVHTPSIIRPLPRRFIFSGDTPVVPVRPGVPLRRTLSPRSLWRRAEKELYAGSRLVRRLSDSSDHATPEYRRERSSSQEYPTLLSFNANPNRQVIRPTPHSMYRISQSTGDYGQPSSYKVGYYRGRPVNNQARSDLASQSDSPTPPPSTCSSTGYNSTQDSRTNTSASSDGQGIAANPRGLVVRNHRISEYPAAAPVALRPDFAKILGVRDTEDSAVYSISSGYNDTSSLDSCERQCSRV